MLSVMEVSATRCEQDSLDSARFKEKFVDTSTWEQIIHVLEENVEVELGSPQGTTTLIQPNRE